MNRINTNNFDFLRVIFAITVAISHLIFLSKIDAFQPFLAYFNTRLAIDGFFVISGFLIAKSYENSQNISQYLIRRVKRILPAYFFVIFFCAITFCLISSSSISEYFFSNQFWKYLLANLTFQNYAEPCLPGVFNNNAICTVNGALWTIKIEEAFYLLVPIFYMIIKFKKINIYFLSLFIYIISIIYYNYFLSIDMYRIAKQLPGALAFFIVGITFYKNFQIFYKWRHHLIIPFLIIFILEHYIFKTQILKPLAFGIIVFYIAYNFKFLNNFGKFGDFTYGIYIYHFPAIQIFVYYNFFDKYNPIVMSILLLLIVVVLAVFSWHFLELRFLSKNRKLRQKKLMNS